MVDLNKAATLLYFKSFILLTKKNKMKNLNVNLNLAWDLWQLLVDYLLRTTPKLRAESEQVSQGCVQLGFE